MLENTIMDKIIGRKAEIKQVLECFESDKSELVSVYGRHRVGKTFLIKRCFNEEFDFWFTGIYKATRVQHLTQFQNVLKYYQTALAFSISHKLRHIVFRWYTY